MNNTLANGLTLLAHLSRTAEPHSLTAIAEALRLPKSHVHRLLQTLVETGYAAQDADRRYRIGLRPLEISSALLSHHPLRRLALPLLHDAAAATGLDAILAVPADGVGLIVAAVSPGGRQRDPAAALGHRLGCPDTATGKLLACLIDGFADTSAVPERERAAIRRTGTAIRDPRHQIACNGIAHAVRATDGTEPAQHAVIAAVGLSGPSPALLRARERAEAALATVAAALAAAVRPHPELRP